MVYLTTLRSVKGAAAVGINGERLEIIGNNPCRAGDRVWTDGRVIFGHSPPRDSSPIISTGGVPLLCQTDRAMEYVNNSGAIRKIPVNVDRVDNNDWIVNNERAFHHFHLEHMVDAEVAINSEGKEDGFFSAHIMVNPSGKEQNRKCAYYKTQNGNVYDDDCIVIKKNDEEIERIYLHNYLDAVDKVNDIYREELGSSQNDNLVEPIYGIAELLAFKLDSKGGWEAIIASFAYGELKFYSNIDVEKKTGYGKYIHTTKESPSYMSIEEAQVMLAGEGNSFAEIFYSAIENIIGGLAALTEVWIAVSSKITFDYIEPPDSARKCSAYYLIRINSNGKKEVLHEEFALQSSKKELVSELTLTETPPSDSDFLGIVTTGYTMTLKGRNAYGMSILDKEVLDARVDHYVVCKTQKSKDGYHEQNFKDKWHFPIQDNFFVEMNEWKVLSIYNAEDGKVVAAETAFYDAGFTIADSRYIPDATNYVEENEKDDQGNDIYKMRYFESGGWDEKESTELKMGYSVDLTSKDFLTPSIPAMTKLKNKYLAIGHFEDKYPLYQMREDFGIFFPIHDNVKNFRLKKMRNFSQIKNKNNWSQ